jgi:predicted nucleic acid-binding protein
VKEYVLDANALIRYLTNGPGADRVARLFSQVQRGEARLSMSVVNRGEVLYNLARRAGLSQASDALGRIGYLVESIPATEMDANGAAVLRFKHKLGYADCFAAEVALRTGATLVTADPDFAKLGKQLKILSLPRHSP